MIKTKNRQVESTFKTDYIFCVKGNKSSAAVCDRITGNGV